MAISVSNPFVQAFMGQISAAEEKRKQEEQNALNLMMSGFDVAPQQPKGVGDALSQALYGPSTAVSRASVGQHHPGEIQKRIQEMVNESFAASNRSREKIASEERALRREQAGLDRTLQEKLANQSDATENRRISTTENIALKEASDRHIENMVKEKMAILNRYFDYVERMEDNARAAQLTPDDYEKLLNLQIQVEGLVEEAAEDTWQDWLVSDRFGLDEGRVVDILTDTDSFFYNSKFAKYKEMMDGFRKGTKRLVERSTIEQARDLTGGVTEEQEEEAEIEETIKEVVKEAGEAVGDPTLNDVDESIKSGSKKQYGGFDSSSIGQLFDFLSRQADSGLNRGRPSTRNWEELVRQYQAATGDTVTRPINGKTLYERVTEWRASQ